MPLKTPTTRAWAIALGLAVLTAVVYLPVLGFHFVEIDDWGYVFQNPRITAGVHWQNLLWYCTHPLGGNWHPLTALSHMLDCQWFGLKPGYHHAGNLLLHAANVVLLFFLVRRFGTESVTIVAAWLAAVVFAIHPLHVESVAWVAERKDVLSGLFFLLTLHAYFNFARGGNRQWYWSCLALFALGLMSKPMLVTTPCVLLLLDHWPLQRSGWKKLLVEKWPFFLLSVADSIFTVLAQSTSGAVRNLQEFGVMTRISSVLTSYWFYVKKFFVATDLAMFYPMVNQPIAVLLLLALFLAAVSALAIWLSKRHRVVLMGWLWFVGMLVPVCGLVQTGAQAYADRYTYLPSIGLSLALFWPLAEFVANRRREMVWAIVGTTVALAVYITIAQRQVYFWQNTETLYTRALTAVPNNYDALVHYAGHYEEIGLLDKASQCYSNAIAVVPDGYALFHLGKIYARKNDLENAQACYETALKLAPDRPEVCRALGRIYDQRNQSEKAAEYFARSVAAKPDFVDGLRDYAWIVAIDPKISATNAPKAVEFAQRAVKLDPLNFSVYAILAGAQARAGRFGEAIETEQRAIAMAEAAHATNVVVRCRQHLALFQKKQMARD